jgi:WD40 repeat protein
LATASTDGTACIWNIRQGGRCATFVGHAVGLTDVDWSLDGNYLATSAGDGTVRIWDAKIRNETQP